MNAAELLPPELWEQIRPLLPPHPEHPRGGHPFASDQDALRGLIYILRTGIPYQMLPTDLFGVSGSTCWRRLEQWTAKGLWPEVHRRLVARLVARLGRLKALDASVAIVDSQAVRAVWGGATPARAPWIAARTAASGTC